MLIFRVKGTTRCCQLAGRQAGNFNDARKSNVPFCDFVSRFANKDLWNFRPYFRLVTKTLSFMVQYCLLATGANKSLIGKRGEKDITKGSVEVNLGFILKNISPGITEVPLEFTILTTGNRSMLYVQIFCDMKFECEFVSGICGVPMCA